MDALKLKWHMNKHNDTVPILAEFLGVNKITLYSKIRNEKQEFTQGEIKKIAERYSLTANEINEIFF